MRTFNSDLLYEFIEKLRLYQVALGRSKVYTVVCGKYKKYPLVVVFKRGVPFFYDCAVGTTCNPLASKADIRATERASKLIDDEPERFLDVPTVKL